MAYAGLLLFLLAWCWGGLPSVWAQQEGVESADYYCRSWLVDDGLPHNIVVRVVQDHSGYLWIGAVTGLARFDGIRFQELPTPSAEHRERYTGIRDFAEETPGQLVVLGANGWMLRFSGAKYTVHPLSLKRKGQSFSKMFLERPGVIWATQNNRLLRYEDGNIEEFGKEAGIEAAGEDISFASDGKGTVWISAGSKLFSYRSGRLAPAPSGSSEPMNLGSSGKGDVWICTDGYFGRVDETGVRVLVAEPPWKGALVSVRCIFEDSGGTVWVGTSRKGLFRYANGKLEAVAIPYRSMRSISEDREGNLWVATDGHGILRLRRKGFQLFNAQNGLSENISSSVCEDPDGNIWLGNRSGHVVRLRNGVPEVFDFPDEDKESVYAHTVGVDRKRRLWVGGPDGVFRVSLDDLGRQKPMQTDLTGVRVMFVSSKDVVWLGLMGPRFGYIEDDVFHDLRLPPGAGLGRLQAIAEDGAGRIWLGGNSGVLACYEKGAFRRYTNRDGLLRQGINSIFPDADGNLWLCTDGGLVLKNDKGFFVFPEGLLPDYLLGQVIEDNSGGLWFSSRRGLFSAKRDDLLAYASGKIRSFHVRTFNKDEGITGISPVMTYQPSICKARDGRVWFATMNGVLAIDPSLISFNDKPPPVFVSEILIDGRPLQPEALSKVPFGLRRIEFRFSALSYTAPEKVRLRCQLEGIDQDWLNVDASRSASYTSLAPGTYRMRVQACNDCGVWNEEGDSCLVTVVPAWWQTAWARLGFVLLCTGLVAASVRYWSQRKLQHRLERLERENALNLERARIARDLHDELGGSLTQISLLAERIQKQENPAEKQRLLPQLSAQARRLTAELASIVWTVSPQNNSLSQLASFVRRYALRLFRDSSTVCTASGVEGIPDLRIAPAHQYHLLGIAKEALNNVLKHSKAGSLEIRMAYEGGEFLMEFKDNGVGFDPDSEESKEGNGIRHMRSRAAEIGGEIELRSGAGQGAHIVVRFSCPKEAGGGAPS